MARIPGTPISGLTNQAILQGADAFAMYASIGGGNAKITGDNLRLAIIGQQSYTISGGAITILTDEPIIYATVDTEGAAASDNLDTINKAKTGQIIILESASNARTVVVRDAGISGGNINTAGSVNFSLASRRDKMLLVERKSADSWDEISRSSN